MDRDVDAFLADAGKLLQVAAAQRFQERLVRHQANVRVREEVLSQDVAVKLSKVDMKLGRRLVDPCVELLARYAATRLQGPLGRDGAVSRNPEVFLLVTCA